MFIYSLRHAYLHKAGRLLLIVTGLLVMVAPYVPKILFLLTRRLYCVLLEGLGSRLGVYRAEGFEIV